MYEISSAAKALEQESEQALSRAQSYPAIVSQDGYSAAESELSALSGTLKSLEAERTKLKAPILEAGRAVDAFFKRPTEFLESARKAIKTRMLSHQDEIERKRKEAERIAAEAARKERERLEREAAKVAEEARRRADEAAEKIRKLEEAGNAERAAAARAKAEAAEKAQTERAEDLRLAAASIPSAPVVSIAAPQAASSSVTRTYDFEIIDERQIPREYLTVNEKAIRQVVKALGMSANISGVRVIEKRGIASRA